MGTLLGALARPTAVVGALGVQKFGTGSLVSGVIRDTYGSGNEDGMKAFLAGRGLPSWLPPPPPNIVLTRIGLFFACVWAAYSGNMACAANAYKKWIGCVRNCLRGNRLKVKLCILGCTVKREGQIGACALAGALAVIECYREAYNCLANIWATEKHGVH